MQLKMVNNFEELQMAYRRIQLIEHIIPTDLINATTRVEVFDAIIMSCGVDEPTRLKCRREGGLQAVDDYLVYTDGGVRSLDFDDAFKHHLLERISEADKTRHTFN